MGNGLATTTVLVSNPPLVIRGCNCQKDSSGERQPDSDRSAPDKPGTLGMHWLRGSILEIHKAWLMEKMMVLFGTKYATKPHAPYKYDCHHVWPCGARVFYQSSPERSDITAGRITLDIPGGALETVDIWYLGCFCLALDNHGFQATRMDLYYDDPEIIIDPHELYSQVYERGGFDECPVRADFIGFRSIEVSDRADKYAGTRKDMVMFGRRGSSGSGKYLRAYDKRLESDGETVAIRYELELSRTRARDTFRELVEVFGASDSGALLDLMGREIGGCIDFKYRTERVGDKHLDRLKRYPWWELILDRIGTAALPTRKIVRTVEKSKKWFRFQAGGILQMVNKAYGPEVWLPELMDLANGEDRIRPHHEKMIEDFEEQRRTGKTDLQTVLASHAPLPEREKQLQAAMVAYVDE